ncbi:MAG TPA: hypothetical protein VFB94_06170 [Acidimicrobiales bacterium]|nr:hypothetical protein [Acidimicrobiales bacterium]
MTDAMPDEPGGGPDDPDLTDPLTAEDILARAGGKTEAGDSQASRLVTLANSRYRLLRGDDGRPYATERQGPAVVYGLRGRDALRKRLAGLFFDTYGSTPGGAALTDALTVIEGMADRAEPEPVGLRVAAAGGNAVVLDLAGEDGRCVVLDPRGWQLQDRSPVLFRRSALTAPLPEPERGGSLDELRRLLNVDEARFRLVVAWLVAALVPDIPHPILALTGEQGTAKSTAARLVVSLIDPSPAPLRTAPNEMRSWAAAASASWIVALDNVSSIPAWFSDTLCKAVTGDGIVERALFTDDDISVISFRRCIALTTIDAGRLAGDLAERLLVVELARIPTDRRRPDAEISAAYAAARPRILGALLDLIVDALGALPAVQLDELPRMADFARILAALDRVRGWDTLATYRTAAAEAVQAVLESDPVAEAVIAFIGRGGGWQGTASELLDRITPERRPRGWPQSPRGLSGALARLAPALRAHGVLIEREARGSERILTLRADDPDIVKRAKQPSRPSRPSRDMP